jgi:hypothetical protein
MSRGCAGSGGPISAEPPVLDPPRSGVGSPAQALELAPQALARPALPTYEHHPWPGHRHDGRAVVHVAGRGDGGPNTRLDRERDLDDALAIGDERLHPITCTNLRRRLRRRSIHEDVAAVAQPGRERAGLHETHGAQPAIDTRLVSSEGLRHASKDGTPRKRVAAVTCRRPLGPGRRMCRAIDRRADARRADGPARRVRRERPFPQSAEATNPRASSRTALIRSLSTPDPSADAVRAVLPDDTAGVVLVGYSFGGFTAARIAVEHPDLPVVYVAAWVPRPGASVVAPTS